MDFSHVGGHCEMIGCNQQDFLPFKCNLCGKNLCLLHRSNVAHSCVAAGNIDVISIPCPICGKSIKMNKNDDANLQWDHHFTTSCEQKSSSSATTTQSPLKCASPSCNTILGPSNQIKCNTCNRQVCISHRAPDSHKCKEYQRANMLQSHSRTNTKSSTTGTSTANQATSNSKNNTSNNNSSRNNNTGSSSNVNKKKNTNEVDISNTLRGTAARRQQNQQTNSNSTSSGGSDRNGSNEMIEACPICGEVFTSLQLLTTHLDAKHFSSSQEVSPPSIPNPSLSSSSQLQYSDNQNRQIENSSNPGTEVCPQCSKSFHDIVDLIKHVEKDHPTTTATDQKSGDNCDLS